MLTVPFALLFLLFSCISKPNTNTNDTITSVDFKRFELKYAKGFEVIQNKQGIQIFIKDTESRAHLDSLWISARNNTNQVKVYTRIVAQSTTHWAFINRIEGLNKLIGLCGIQYLSSDQATRSKNISEICSSQGLNIEHIVALDPEIVFLYPFGDKDKEALTRLGLTTLYLNEYAESTPLARAEWLKLFALLTGIDPNQTYFEDIEKEYLRLKRDTSKDKLLVAFNLPFGDTWDMPSGNSMTAALVRDAGMYYPMSETKGNSNLVFRYEEAYKYLSAADYWIIIADRKSDFSFSQLLAENKIYGTFRAVKNRQVIFCNTSSSPYFSEAPTEPHVLLGDLIRCIEQPDLKNKYFNLLK